MSPQGQVALYVSLIALMMIFSGLFSCADMTYSVAPIKKLRKKGTKSAKLAADMAEKYESTIVTVLFLNNLVNILASSFGAALSRVELTPFGTDASALWIEAIMLLLILTFGEILPKVIGRVYSYHIAIWMAKPIKVLGYVFYPVVKAATFLAGAISSPIIEKAAEPDEAPSDEELQAMIDTIEEEGLIDEDQSELLTRSIQFKDTSAREIMTPRVKIEAIEYSMPLDQYVQQEGAFKHSRIPVYKKNLDHIIGYIPVKEMQKAILRGKRLVMDDLILPILAVPSTLEISSILSLMKRSHHHIALVKDEFGGNAGIITVEDILEELVGEMWDESEAIAEDIVKLEKRNQYLVKGSMEKYAFFDYFELDEDVLDEDYTTVSGWINDKLGKFAKEGDKFSYQKIDIKVKKASPYTVEEVLVIYHPRRKIKD